MNKLNNAPRWVFILIAVLSAVVLGYFGWQAISGQSADLGPSKKIAPGTYDLRAEAAKMQDSKRTGASTNEPQQ